MIYYLQELGNPYAPIKIGYTAKDPYPRLAHAQHGYPFGRLVIVATHSGTKDEESACHARWHRHRMQGEWFAATPEILEHIRTTGDAYHMAVSPEVRDLMRNFTVA